MTDMEMAGGGWIDASERPPTERDADEQNCVLAWHALNGAMITGWHQFGRNRYLTHWQQLPDKPEARNETKTERRGCLTKRRQLLFKRKKAFRLYKPECLR